MISLWVILYKKILVPYDGSNYSKNALKHAIEFAKKFDSTLYLLTVIDEHEYIHGLLLAELEDNYTVRDSVKKFVKSEVIASKKSLAKLAKKCEKNEIMVHHHVMRGNPIEGIFDYEKANKIELIIMGSKGLSGISKLMALGSVSRKISELAKCPVMIVR